MSATVAGAAPAVDAGTDMEEAAAAARDTVADYWRWLRLTDEALIAALTADCLTRARRLLGRGTTAELTRRAIEEAQRRFDHALAAAIGMPPSNDPHPLAAARAALLLTPGLCADCLFRHDDSTRELKAILEARLPRAIPPEARVAMQPVPLRFWLFQSTDA